MSRFYRLAVFVAALLAVFVIPGVVSAHEHREVGQYEFVVGFANEPAYENEQNGMWVSVKNHETGEPVEDLEGTLKAQLIFGSQQRDMQLSPVYGEQGVYISNFYPTVAGDYTFRFFGDIDGTQVDEKFTSSPGGFNAVSSVNDLQFPVRLGTNAQLQEQIRSAQLLGAAGLGAGIAGLVLAVWALRSRRPAATAATRTLGEV